MRKDLRCQRGTTARIGVITVSGAVSKRGDAAMTRECRKSCIGVPAQRVANQFKKGLSS
jgi:hypothetical protein